MFQRLSMGGNKLGNLTFGTRCGDKLETPCAAHPLAFHLGRNANPGIMQLSFLVLVKAKATT